ncbi:hypothetical protein CCR75_000744 [Bremia lactucae]|uniref:Protein kinase domain-containing protein n=1 Tax=Bremia lactucae TaxID=4779 RepID=A0A976IJ26_BRELC|nr:hypothetical protein CCR75_000744 [Bremia lactucae]
MIDDVAVFEKVAKKSWQSFSTMRRFVDEAVRLENASWRLWFIKGTHVASSTDSSDEFVSEDDGASAKELRPVCVYCELHRASLRCNGCCHDAYCVSCFKFIHKKGNLATHTAERIQFNERLEVINNCVPSIVDEGDLSTKSHRKSSEGDTETSSGGSSTPQNAKESLLNKPWELQMDMLLQRLMSNSLYSNKNISVHNIDNRVSLLHLDTLDSNVATFEIEKPYTMDSSNMSNTVSHDTNQAAVMAAVASAGRHRALSMPLDVIGKYSPPVRIWSVPPFNSDKPIHERQLSAALSLNEVPRKNSRRKDIQTCANCQGNHITVACPLLENALLPVASGIDTVLRKCYTTIHNNHMANSTHAFLGDEGSVHGTGNAVVMKSWPLNCRMHQVDRPALYGMNVIAEDNSMTSEDLAPRLKELTATNAGNTRPNWHADSWFLPCLATDLPFDVFLQLRDVKSATFASILSGPPSSRMAFSGWVYMKIPGSHWAKRFLSIERNNLWEYLDANETSRPVGHANVYEGTVHQQSLTELVLKYDYGSSTASERRELWLQFESHKETTQWKAIVTHAVHLQIEDLFDLTPDSPTGIPLPNLELGKGRFSIVRRAREKENVNDPIRSRDCALKIIDKHLFWDLVARETERHDTVVREILTQTLLTIRSGSSYCPVIRLLSLFETRDYLVLELELMKDGDLHEEIATKCAVDELQASYLIASLVRAIDFCQQNGIAHRDVKLSNLALDYAYNSSGREYAVIKVADFGMAAFIQANGMLKGRCGTPGFVAPEILCAGKGEAYPSGVDMFSAGVVAYTMLCGYEPFFGVNDSDLIQMNKLVEYEFEEPEWASISEEAKDMITRMMEKDPYKRITPKEVLQHPFLREATVALEDLFIRL